MMFLWALVIFAGIVMFVLGPVLLVTKHMVLVGIVLGGAGILVLTRGLAGASENVRNKGG